MPSFLAPRIERALVEGLATSIREGSPYRHRLILGPRRVGKTTIQYQVVRRLINAGVPPDRLWWYRLDHPELLRMSLGDLMAPHRDRSPDDPTYVFLDELVYARDWDLWLKTFFDERWPIRVVGTSSAVADLRQRRVESGVGRWEEEYVPPWLFHEYLDLRLGSQLPFMSTAKTPLQTVLEVSAVRRPEEEFPAGSWLTDYLLLGGFPELLVPVKDETVTDAIFRSQRVLRSDAVERAIYKDLPQTFQIREPVKLERLLYVLAGQIGQLISPTGLAQDVGATQPTIDAYIRYLERCWLVFTLNNHAVTEGERQRRGRKLYFVDGAVRNAALQRGIAPLDRPDEMGRLRENAVAAHLHALSQQVGGARLAHWRDGKDEVDFVWDEGDGPLAIEVSSSANHSTRALRRFQDEFPRFAGACWLVYPGALARAPRAAPDGIGRFPLERFFMSVGLLAESALLSRHAT